MTETEKRIERCRNCVCLVEEDGEWYCDECYRFCKEIDICPEEDCPEPDDLEMGFDPYLGCYTDDV